MPATHPLFALLIDDDEHDLFFLEESLNSCGFFSIVACRNDGENLNDFLHGLSRLPDVIITDINMPKVNGFEVLAGLKNDPKLSQIPVIIHSSSCRLRDVEKAKELGAAGFITKANCYDGIMKSADVIRDILDGHCAFHTVLYT